MQNYMLIKKNNNLMGIKINKKLFKFKTYILNDGLQQFYSESFEFSILYNFVYNISSCSINL